MFAGEDGGERVRDDVDGYESAACISRRLRLRERSDQQRVSRQGGRREVPRISCLEDPLDGRARVNARVTSGYRHPVSKCTARGQRGSSHCAHLSRLEDNSKRNPKRKSPSAKGRRSGHVPRGPAGSHKQDIQRARGHVSNQTMGSPGSPRRGIARWGVYRRRRRRRRAAQRGAT